METEWKIQSVKTAPSEAMNKEDREKGLAFWLTEWKIRSVKTKLGEARNK